MNKLSVTMTRTEKLLGWIYYPLQLLVIPFAVTIVNILCGMPLTESWLNIVFFSLNFFAVALIFPHFLIGNGKIALENIFRTLQSAVLGLGVYWLLSYVVQLIIFTVDPGFFNVNDAYIDGMAHENFGIFAFCTVILVPIAEETLYRGLMFGQLYNRNRLAAYLISTLVFALVHVIGYIGQYSFMQLMLCVLQYLPAGLCLGWAYARADSIWASILIHIAINQIGVYTMR